MNLAVIGASAGVGLAVVELALERGHAVTSLSRSVETLPAHPSLRVIQGSSTEFESVSKTVSGADAILVTLGTGMNTKPTTLYSQSAQILVQALNEKQSTVPLIVLTGFGAGDSWGYNTFLVKTLFRIFLKEVYADKTAMERLIADGATNWIMVRPGRLTNGTMTGHYRVLSELSEGMRVGAISRADVAHFMVSQAETPRNLGQYPALSY